MKGGIDRSPQCVKGDRPSPLEHSNEGACRAEKGIRPQTVEGFLDAGTPRLIRLPGDVSTPGNRAAGSSGTRMGSLDDDANLQHRLRRGRGGTGDGSAVDLGCGHQGFLDIAEFFDSPAKAAMRSARCGAAVARSPNGFMECLYGTASVRFDVGFADNLLPFLGFVEHEFSKVGGCHQYWISA